LSSYHTTTLICKFLSLNKPAFELYYKNNVVPVDKKYRKYASPDNGVFKRLGGDTYDELFSGVQSNYDYLVDA
jgi:hypothetical protein